MQICKCKWRKSDTQVTAADRAGYGKIARLLLSTRNQLIDAAKNKFTSEWTWSDMNTRAKDWPQRHSGQWTQELIFFVMLNFPVRSLLVNKVCKKISDSEGALTPQPSQCRFSEWLSGRLKCWHCYRWITLNDHFWNEIWWYLMSKLLRHFFCHNKSM